MRFLAGIYYLILVAGIVEPKVEDETPLLRGRRINDRNKVLEQRKEYEGFLERVLYYDVSLPSDQPSTIPTASPKYETMPSSSLTMITGVNHPPSTNVSTAPVMSPSGTLPGTSTSSPSRTIITTSGAPVIASTQSPFDSPSYSSISIPTIIPVSPTSDSIGGGAPPTLIPVALPVVDLPTSTSPTSPPTSGTPMSPTPVIDTTTAPVYPPNSQTGPVSIPTTNFPETPTPTELDNSTLAATIEPTSVSTFWDCDDGNVCTVDRFDVDANECMHDQYIECDDNDPATIDMCHPTNGCQFYTADTLPENDVKGTMYYQEASALTAQSTGDVINWLKAEVTQVKLPFCWKQSYGRGAGEPLSACPDGTEQIGALCYPLCPAGFARFGFDCHQSCTEGFRDDGLFCRRAEYGRGFGYPLWDNGRCEQDNGVGNCEQCLLLIYPKCATGFGAFGCNICRPSPPDCSALGYADQFDLSCTKKIITGAPVPLVCPSTREQNGALCYPFCGEGFYGAGPVCWQSCDVDQVDCAAACSKTTADCALAVVDQVLSPIVVAANIATMGLAGTSASSAKAVQVGGKWVTSSNRVGTFFLKAADILQTIEKLDTLDDIYDYVRIQTSVIGRIKNARWGSTVSKVFTTAKVSSLGYKVTRQFLAAFADDFATMTSQEINDALEEKLGAYEARRIKEIWAQIQFSEMSAEYGWQTAQNALTVVSIVDISGVTGVVAAYAKPVCKEIIPFPEVDFIE